MKQLDEDFRTRLAELTKPWWTFLRIFTDPFFLLLLVVTALLGYVQQTRATDSLVSTALVVLIGLFSGVAGAILQARYSDIEGKKVLIARGKTAIRALGLLVREIQALEERVTDYRRRHSGAEYDREVGSEVVKTYLEEVSLKCISLQDQGLSSIENWKDIIPEADVPKQAGIVADLKAQLAEERADRAALLQEFEDRLTEGEEAKKELRELRKKIAQKDRRIGSLTVDLSEADPLSVGTLVAGSSAISGFDYRGGSVNFEGLSTLYSSCPHCERLVPHSAESCPYCGNALPDDPLTILTGDE